MRDWEVNRPSHAVQTFQKRKIFPGSLAGIQPSSCWGNCRIWSPLYLCLWLFKKHKLTQKQRWNLAGDAQGLVSWSIPRDIFVWALGTVGFLSNNGFKLPGDYAFSTIYTEIFFFFFIACNILMDGSFVIY